jgi:hypothetical protein
MPTKAELQAELDELKAKLEGKNSPSEDHSALIEEDPVVFNSRGEATYPASYVHRLRQALSK